MILAYAYCNVSVAPVRSEPAHKSEQTTQLLFGEKVEIFEIDSNMWAKIRVKNDGYDGWCKLGQLQIITVREYKKPIKHIAIRENDAITSEASTLWTPSGSEIVSNNLLQAIPTLTAPKFKGKKVEFASLLPNGEAIIDYAQTFLNSPYQWGGKTKAGIDCSGLVQVTYKMCGMLVPRDASQQAEIGESLHFLVEAKAGDLAFFDNTEGKIVHVGILIDSQTIIHATDTSGRVVIDKIDNGGIISVSLRKRTHNLRLLKRIVG